MKTASFSFVAKFPAKKVRDCFTNPAFAKVHAASKLFAKAGVIKADKNTIIRTVAIPGNDKSPVPVIAVITFTEAKDGKSTSVDAVFTNVPDAKVAEVKAYGKAINADITTFLTPKPKAVKAPAKKAAKKPAAKKAVKAAKPAADKKVAAKKPVAKKAAKPAAKKAAKPAAKKAAKPVAPAPDTSTAKQG